MQCVIAGRLFAGLKGLSQIRGDRFLLGIW